MRTRIYQINSKRDVNRVKFEGLDLLERYQGSSAVDPSIYDEVFNAEIWHGSSSRTSRSNLRTKLPRKMIWKKNPFKG